MHRYLALLRGINVGGKNTIRMTDLKACFTDMGFSDVETYIQSGNVIFSSNQQDAHALTEAIEAGLSKCFNYHSSIVLVTKQQLAHNFKQAPEDFGCQAELFRYDVLFLKNPLTVAAAMDAIRLRPGVDQAWQGDNVLYFARLISKAGQSYLTKIISQPVYKQMTIRNWNTTSRLWTMMEER